MDGSIKEQMIDKLRSSQNQVSALLESVANYQDWQNDPEHWSFRYVAAHLATTEDECFLNRVKQFSREQNPHFDHYHNTDRDFSQFELRDSLQRWATKRLELLDMVHTLPEHIWLRSASHSTRGTQTLPELLQVMLEHDQGHLQELKQMINKRGNEM